MTVDNHDHFGDLAAVEEIATRMGAKILLTGDPAQLSAPGAGGAMRLLADEPGAGWPTGTWPGPVT